jgi:hypothetical protein
MDFASLAWRGLRALSSLPLPLLVLLSLPAFLVAVGVARRARDALLGPAAENPYRHLRHRHRANKDWRPQAGDHTRRLLFFATGRRVTTDFLHPLFTWGCWLLLGLCLLPAPVKEGLAALLRNVRNDSLAYVAVMIGTTFLTDAVKNITAAAELTTTHMRFDKNDRVQFHCAGQPSGVVRHITSHEVVLKSDSGGHVFIPASLAIATAVTVFDEDSDEDGDDAPCSGSPTPGVAPLSSRRKPEGNGRGRAQSGPLSPRAPQEAAAAQPPPAAAGGGHEKSA